MSMVTLVTPIALAVLMTIYQKYFTEFNSEINSISTFLNINVDKSTKIRKLYPLLLAI